MIQNRAGFNSTVIGEDQAGFNYSIAPDPTPTEAALEEDGTAWLEEDGTVVSTE